MKQKIVRIPRGMVRGKPVELTVTDPESSVEIIVEKGARGEVVLKLDSNVARHSLLVVLGDQSQLVLTSLLVDRPASEIQVEQKATIGAYSKLHVCNATLGGHVEHSLVSRITGSNSESSIDWVFSGRGEDRLHLSVKNLFDAPSGRGEITVKGVAEGRAHCTCNGIIEITERGRGTDTYLTETMLMLDATARCDAVPALEIKTNDVKASHSATVTKVSEEDLFYLSTRGIPEAQARRMFVEGFLSAMVERFPAFVREEILMAIGGKYELRPPHTPK